MTFLPSSRLLRPCSLRGIPRALVTGPAEDESASLGIGGAERERPFQEAQKNLRSEMALFFECVYSCARKALGTSDILREPIFQQLQEG